MEILNAPTRESCTIRRERADTPLQALVTMNDVQFVEAARTLADRIAQHLGIGTGLGDFARITPAALVEAQVAATSNPDASIADRFAGELSFFPFVDGEVIPESPMGAISAGATATLPLLIGTTEQEFNAMVRLAPVDDETADHALGSLGLDEAGVAAYRAARRGAEVRG